MPANLPIRSSFSFDEFFSAITGWHRAGERLHAAGVIAERSGVELDRWLHPVLFTVAVSGPLRVIEIARLIGILETTASRHVKRLAGLGYVVSAIDQSDRRAINVELTEKGVAAHRSLQRAWTSIFADATTDWTDGERKALSIAFARFVHGVDLVTDS
jgi:MarR family transcriptional regulator, organic hydroperoxide resistance regulator